MEETDFGWEDLEYKSLGYKSLATRAWNARARDAKGVGHNTFVYKSLGYKGLVIRSAWWLDTINRVFSTGPGDGLAVLLSQSTARQHGVALTRSGI